MPNSPCHWSSKKIFDQYFSTMDKKRSFVFRNALDRGYKNHIYCQKLLDCCSHLPNNICFNDEEVQVQFFRIVAGFKWIILFLKFIFIAWKFDFELIFRRIGSHIKYTSKVKTHLVRCLLNIEKRVKPYNIKFAISFHLYKLFFFSIQAFRKQNIV